MTGTTLAIAGFLAMLALIAVRVPVGLAMLGVGAVGYLMAHPSGSIAFISYMKTNSFRQFANYTLSVIPLFILMGAIAERAGISQALFRSAARAVGHLRGGLAMAVILACTAFGAICGSSVATTATFGRAALPELDRYRYDGGFSTGTIAVGGTLGILIPPSVILVVYCISTEQNIVKLFKAALIPGLIAALFYCIVIWLVVRRRPELAPPVDPASLAQDAKSGVSVWPAILVALIVVGGIYGGVFTPTEGAAAGAVAMLLVGFLQGGLTLTGFVESLKQTAETSGMIFIILLGSEVFSAFLALTGLPPAAAQWVVDLGFSPFVVLVAMMAFYILLGAVMDELAMLLLTLPLFFPIVMGLDFGMPQEEVAIWFGILVLIIVGIGLTCPPIGLNVFVISAIARDGKGRPGGVPIAATYRGVLPFIAADIVRLGLIIAMPGLALWLVRVLP